MNPNDPFYQLAVALAKMVGVTPLTIVGFVPILVMLANFISKLIPDDATGWRAVVRKIAGFIGLAYANRVTSSLTTADVATMFLRTKGIPVGAEKIDEVATKVEALGVPSETVLTPEPPQPAPSPNPKLFAGVTRDPTTGKFVKIESPLWVGVLIGAMILMSGCANQRLAAASYACAHADQIRAADPIARLKVMTITDPLARQAALAGLDLTLAALATCPVKPAPTPTGN